MVFTVKITETIINTFIYIIFTNFRKYFLVVVEINTIVTVRIRIRCIRKIMLVDKIINTTICETKKKKMLYVLTIKTQRLRAIVFCTSKSLVVLSISSTRSSMLFTILRLKSRSPLVCMWGAWLLGLEPAVITCFNPCPEYIWV